MKRTLLGAGAFIAMLAVAGTMLAPANAKVDASSLPTAKTSVADKYDVSRGDKTYQRTRLANRHCLMAVVACSRWCRNLRGWEYRYCYDRCMTVTYRCPVY
jgi:hypothetical protein